MNRVYILHRLGFRASGILFVSFLWPSCTYNISLIRAGRGSPTASFLFGISFNQFCTPFENLCRCDRRFPLDICYELTMDMKVKKPTATVSMCDLTIRSPLDYSSNLHNITSLLPFHRSFIRMLLKSAFHPILCNSTLVHSLFPTPLSPTSISPLEPVSYHANHTERENCNYPMIDVLSDLVYYVISNKLTFFVYCVIMLCYASVILLVSK